MLPWFIFSSSFFFVCDPPPETGLPPVPLSQGLFLMFFGREGFGNSRRRPFLGLSCFALPTLITPAAAILRQRKLRSVVRFLGSGGVPAE